MTTTTTVPFGSGHWLMTGPSARSVGTPLCPIGLPRLVSKSLFLYFLAVLNLKNINFKGDDALIRVWDLRYGAQPVLTLRDHTNCINTVNRDLP